MLKVLKLKQVSTLIILCGNKIMGEREMNYSPLRYPGGKTKLAPLVELLMKNTGIEKGVYIEPFAGGAGVALSLLFM